MFLGLLWYFPLPLVGCEFLCLFLDLTLEFFGILMRLFFKSLIHFFIISYNFIFLFTYNCLLVQYKGGCVWYGNLCLQKPTAITSILRQVGFHLVSYFNKDIVIPLHWSPQSLIHQQPNQLLFFLSVFNSMFDLLYLHLEVK